MLVLVFGSTQVAVTTVLTTFMAGLALGSVLLGRFIDRFPRPLIVYGIIEIIIGFYSIVTPSIFEGIRAIYLSSLSNSSFYYTTFNFTQFSLSFLGIIIPATLMGGTLPILIKFFAEMKEKIGFEAGLLYSINTMGAVLGCSITGFFLLYILGVKESLYTAGGIDILVGVVIIFFSYAMKGRGQEAVPEVSGERLEVLNVKSQKHHRKSSLSTTVETHALKPATAYIVLAAFALSGFAALAYEVLWFRIFSLVVGSSIYAFTIMLSTFLFGIAFGSASFAPFIDKRKIPLFWFGLLESIIGFSVLISIFLYKELPFIFTKMSFSFSGHFWLFLFLQALLCGTVMIVPTFCMGAIFPTVSRIYSKDLNKIGTSIGNIYFYNTLGSIFGSFAGGFILVPFIGIQQSIILITLLNISLGIILTFISSSHIKVKISFAAVSILILIPSIFFLPPWEKMVMTMGTYVNPVSSTNPEVIKKDIYKEELLFYKEGLNATITTKRSADGKTITYQANGKNEARAIGSRPAEAWSVLGHIPMLLSKETREVLLIGLGSGITLGAVEQYPAKHIDVVEIEPAVVEASRFFSDANNNAIDDSRVDLHITDGRNFPVISDKTYDVIISAVSDPWITGVANLFTQEYFKELDDKIAENGVVALWFQNYRTSLEDLKTGLNTFASVFPHVSLWFHYAGTADLIVIGSKSEHTFDFDDLSKKMALKNVKKDLSKIDLNDPYDILNLFLMGNKDIRRYITGASINTDNHNILEFRLPKLLYRDPGEGNNERVTDIIGHATDFIPISITEKINKEAFYFELGKTYFSFVFREDQAKQLFKKVLDLNPEHQGAIDYLKELKRLEK